MTKSLFSIFGSNGYYHRILCNFQIIGTSPYFSICHKYSRSSSSFHDTFKYSDLYIQRCRQYQCKPKPDWTKLKFGHAFSDHMFIAEWTRATGWDRPRIVPFQPLALHPGSKVLHYATELYEGLKAYRGVDNTIRLFRPELNLNRMLVTSERAELPAFDTGELLSCLAELIRVDQDWVPDITSSSLYVRPTSIATDPTLGITESNDAMLFVILSPVAAYYSTGLAPVTLLADPSSVRTSKGGVGMFKMGCFYSTFLSNYAPTIHIAKKALQDGYHQVLWLYGEDELITEVGTMNIFVVWRNEQNEYELITPTLTSGLILPGITRRSCLELVREWNIMKVTERDLTIHEVLKAGNEGRLMEVFGTGTACVVNPVDKIVYRKDGVLQTVKVPTMEQQSSVMQRLYDALTDIQYGRVSRPDWVKVVLD